uniref:Ig-like domain-containing protein n=1 Tax=Amphilophus citrinellus TaxID=61819 RepID=A0A3Q0RYY5_AMPCI
FCLSLICCVLLLVVVCSAVHQIPANIYTRGEEAKIHCSHNITSYNQILWYKQSRKQLQLLGYMVLTAGNPEPGVNVVMDGNANQGQNCTLTIKEINLNSSGVYFCAARYHSAAHHCTSIQKPHKHIFTGFFRGRNKERISVQ